MALPSTVLAVYKGVNVSVRLPPWTLSFQKQCKARSQCQYSIVRVEQLKKQ